MSFFDKIKQNIEHGGVNVTLNAAQSVSQKDQTLPVTVTISNSPEMVRTIKSVTAEVQATENASGMSMALNNTVQVGNTTDDSEMYNMQTIIVAQANSAETFVLQPNESKTITLDIVINNGESNPTDGIMGHLANMAKKVNQNGYKYELHVKADVEGVSLDPHAHQALEIV